MAHGHKFRLSSVVEQSAVNAFVAGSNPSDGVNVKRIYMKKKSPKQVEKDNLTERKNTADKKWDHYITRIESGKKIDHQRLSQLMDECNNADYSLILRGYRELL